MMDFLLNKNFWFPSNHTNWTEIDYSYLKSYTDVLTYPFIIAVILYFVRFTFENYVAKPIGVYFGIKADAKQQKSSSEASSNGVDYQLRINKNVEAALEQYYKSCRNPSESILNDLSKEHNIPYERIKEWFETKQSLSRGNKPTKMNKFTECTWRFTFYIAIFFYGVFSLFNKSWSWETMHCWKNYPRVDMDSEIYWYYMIELGFYWSLLYSQFSDIKRKDFWQMFTHHVITIALMTYSYILNFHRIGSLIVVLHDGADFWLELAKMAKYANLQFLCDSAFIIFALVWFVTRLVIFPFKIIYTTTFEGPVVLGYFWSYQIFNVMLYLLQVMHIIWFYMILKVAYKAITIGKVDKDDRSESDDASNHEKQT